MNKKEGTEEEANNNNNHEEEDTIQNNNHDDPHILLPKSKSIPPIRTTTILSHPHMQDYNHIIFPQNKHIKRWDLLILTLLFLLLFILPYQIGISGGYYLYENIPWFLFNVFINICFIMDTILYFWRSHRDHDGRLIFRLKTIRRRYLRKYFWINLISCLPTTIIFFFLVRHTRQMNNNNNQEKGTKINITVLSTCIKFFDLLKFARFVRIKSIIKSSVLLTDWYLRCNQQRMQLLKYSLLIILVSHWFACTWSFVAFVEADTFYEPKMIFYEDGATQNNWIGYWCINNCEEGGIRPVGWDGHWHRYVLSLFWSVQTITSIGYGNVSPHTTMEWFVGSLLMLGAGIMWAYIIGGLVGVAAGMEVRNEIYRGRIDEANALAVCFDLGNSGSVGVQEKEDGEEVQFEMKRYIQKQCDLGYRTSSCATTLNDAFPVMDSLSPNLQNKGSFMVFRNYLEKVPYLSSKYLSINERCRLARECYLMEFPPGEMVPVGDNHDVVLPDGFTGRRGIYLLMRGTAFAQKYVRGVKVRADLLMAGMVFGEDVVLISDNERGLDRGPSYYLYFLTFGKVIFIPRDAVMTALDHNPHAWNDCARWKLLKALIIFSADCQRLQLQGVKGRFKNFV